MLVKGSTVDCNHPEMKYESLCLTFRGIKLWAISAIIFILSNMKSTGNTSGLQDLAKTELTQ